MCRGSGPELTGDVSAAVGCACENVWVWQYFNKLRREYVELLSIIECRLWGDGVIWGSQWRIGQGLGLNYVDTRYYGVIGFKFQGKEKHVIFLDRPTWWAVYLRLLTKHTGLVDNVCRWPGVLITLHKSPSRTVSIQQGYAMWFKWSGKDFYNSILFFFISFAVRE